MESTPLSSETNLMTKTDNTSTSLVSRRTGSYKMLFGAQPDSLSSLRRSRVRTPVYSSVEERREQITDKITCIINQHQEDSLDADKEAIFSFLNPEIQASTINISARVFNFWEQTLICQGRPSFFSPEELNLTKISDDTKSLILETAVAIMQTRKYFENRKGQLSSGAEIRIASIIANWGPEFFKKWMDGTIVDQWCRDNQFDDLTAYKWKKAFTPGRLKEIIARSISDPVKALDRTRHNYEVLLSDENIAKELDWPINEIKSIVKHSLRIGLAVNNIADPIKALRKIKFNLDNILTDENIAKELDWPIDQVENYFTPAVKKAFAVSYRDDPMTGVRYEILHKNKNQLEPDWQLTTL